MSDFLTNLVMRSFAQTPSVQPVALSTYAAPEPQLETDPVEHVVEPVRKTEPSRPATPRVQNTETVQNTDEREPVIEKVPPVATPPIRPIHSEKNAETRQPESLPESVFASPAKPDNTIAPPVSPKQHVLKSPAVQVQKVVEPLIVEQVVERVTERPTVKTIERPTITTIERSTTEIIERPSVITTERTIEHSTEQQSSITIENTEHVTNSFTTLVPKVTPQSLPATRNLKHRPARSQTTAPDEEQQQTPAPSPETVVNVAIGRIEVRATPAPTTRRERQGPKVMTLDDYLQQRSRGTQ